MRRCNILLAISVFAGVLLAPVAQAACPANPLSTLDGTTWIYHAESVAGFHQNAYLGKFTATLDAVHNKGILTLTETSNINGTMINRDLVYTGLYVMNSDCSGGTFFFNSGANDHPQLEFLIRSPGTNLRMISISAGLVIAGEAEKQP